MSVPEIFAPADLADRLDVSVRTLARWRAQRCGPAWVRLNGVIRYRGDDVDAWLNANRCEAVADGGRT